MAKRLATYVSVTDEGGVAHAFGPDDKVPSWASKLIVNPKAWASGEGVPEPDEETPDEETPDEETPDEVPIPAKSGPKASAAAWAEYAKAKGYEIEEGTSRSEIIDALEADGTPTE